MNMISRFSLAALLLAPLAAFAAEASQQIKRITNDALAVTVSARDAGAVCGLVYDGQERAQDRWQGRQHRPCRRACLCVARPLQLERRRRGPSTLASEKGEFDGQTALALKIQS